MSNDNGLQEIQGDLYNCIMEETTLVFPSQDVMLNWTRDIAIENRFILVILRSITNTRHKKGKMFVTNSKKCKCPFRPRGKASKKVK
ncbi:hypothetical protein CR513_10677, partial [Mucuna pruriens]